jgi:hypothetical protein
MGSEGERGHIADATALLDYGFASARSLPVMRGYPFTLGDGSIDQAAAAAKVDAMAWIAASPVALMPDSEPVIEPEPILVERSPERVAGWEDALSWAERYWTWLLGES